MRNSGTEGLGIFATRDIPRGTVVRKVNVVREISEAEPPRREQGELPEHCAFVDGRVLLYGYPDRHMNHCCEPNVFYDYCEDPPLTRTLRAIKVGEELTVDYLINNAGGDSWPCNCGSPRCRGQTGTSFFALPRAFQVEYLPLLAPWFVTRYAVQLQDIQRDKIND